MKAGRTYFVLHKVKEQCKPFCVLHRTSSVPLRMCTTEATSHAEHPVVMHICDLIVHSYVDTYTHNFVQVKKNWYAHTIIYLLIATVYAILCTESRYSWSLLAPK